MSVYLKLFHGRRELDEDLHDDRGVNGPIFGPFPFFHTTYSCDIKFGDEGHMLRVVGDCVYYDGMYYGDWSAFSSEVLDRDTRGELQARLVPFDQAKADLPQTKTHDPGRSERVPDPGPDAVC